MKKLISLLLVFSTALLSTASTRDVHPHPHAAVTPSLADCGSVDHNHEDGGVNHVCFRHRREDIVSYYETLSDGHPFDTGSRFVLSREARSISKPQPEFIPTRAPPRST